MKFKRINGWLMVIRPNEDAYGIRLRWHGAFYDSHTPTPAVDAKGWAMEITGWDVLLCITITKVRRTGRKAKVDEIGRFKRANGATHRRH